MKKVTEDERNAALFNLTLDQYKRGLEVKDGRFVRPPTGTYNNAGAKPEAGNDNDSESSVRDD